MSRRAAKALLKKDILGITGNIQVWLPMLIIPFIFSLVLPAVLVLPARYYDLSTVGDLDQIIKLLTQLPPGPLRETLLSFPTVNQQIIYFAVNFLFAPLFLVIPLMTASVIGTNSFAGEKEQKTLETLLFAPLDLKTLFGAKILAAFLPAVILTLICSVLYGIIVNITAYPLFGRFIFPQGNWLLLLLWVTPALSLGAVLLNVFISAKVRGFQEAYQLSGVVILPILALFFGQITGILLLNNSFLWWCGAALWLGDLLLFKRCDRFFNRNQLFSRQVP